MLLHIINAFVVAYCDTIDGRLSSASATAELYGGLPPSISSPDTLAPDLDLFYA